MILNCHRPLCVNLDEQVWKHVKASVAERLVTSADDLKTKLNSAMRRLQKRKHIIRGFFQHPDCRYIPNMALL